MCISVANPNRTVLGQVYGSNDLEGGGVLGECLRYEQSRALLCSFSSSAHAQFVLNFIHAYVFLFMASNMVLMHG